MADRQDLAIVFNEIGIQKTIHSTDDCAPKFFLKPAARCLVEVPDHRAVLVVLLGAEALEPFNHGAGEAALLQPCVGVPGQCCGQHAS